MHSPGRINFEKLDGLITEHLGKKLPLVVYRFPHSDEFRAIFQDTPGSISSGRRSGPGFVMAPFDPDSRAALWLPADRMYLCPAPVVSPDPAHLRIPPDLEGRQAHLDLITDAIAEIRRGRLQKVVLARRIQIPCDRKPQEVFLRLSALYPGAFRYLFYHPDHGAWLGASPEILLSYQAGIGKTVSLAGTLPASGNDGPSWSPKELQEQQIVTDYIHRKARELGIHPEVSNPSSVRAGGLWHLKTELSFEATPTLASSLAAALHPTPAICGYPRDSALDFIRSRELSDREFYSGYLGESGISGPGSLRLFVNLRCMKLDGGQASIYVGGGITSDSNPESEWEETRLKSHTMLRALQV